MALIGEMHYLTIGENTYSLPISGGGEGSVTSVAVTNATNGGLSISGSPITTSGIITVGHSNVLTNAQTTQAVYPIKIDKNGHISEYGTAVTIPTKTSDLTNDSGFITSFTDVNVTNTAVTAATTYYLTGSTSSSTTTGGLSKHAAIKAYVTANSGTGGSARIDLGNTTATTSSGGKEGIVRLYGTSATYYVDVKAGAPSANRTITLPNKTGTVALTDDIPTTPTITLNGTSTITPSFYAPTTAGTNGYFLKSNGSGAPTWAEIETTAVQIVRW